MKYIFKGKRMHVTNCSVVIGDMILKQGEVNIVHTEESQLSKENSVESSQQNAVERNKLLTHLTSKNRKRMMTQIRRIQNWATTLQVGYTNVQFFWTQVLYAIYLPETLISNSTFQHLLRNQINAYIQNTKL